MEYKDLVNNNLAYSPNVIAFTDYNGSVVFSDKFSGCLMAAFRFRRQPSPNVRFQYNRQAFNFSDNMIDRPYIAHIYTDRNKERDTKFVFAQLEQEGYIYIEAMFKPSDQDRDLAHNNEWRIGLDQFYSNLIRADSWRGSDVNVIGFLSMNTDGEWTAGINNQYTNKWYRDANDPGTPLNGIPQPYMRFNAEFLHCLTYYYKGFLGIVLNDRDFERIDERYRERYRFAYRKGRKEGHQRTFTEIIRDLFE